MYVTGFFLRQTNLWVSFPFITTIVYAVYRVFREVAEYNEDFVHTI